MLLKKLHTLGCFGNPEEITSFPAFRRRFIHDRFRSDCWWRRYCL